MTRSAKNVHDAQLITPARRYARQPTTDKVAADLMCRPVYVYLYLCASPLWAPLPLFGCLHAFAWINEPILLGAVVRLRTGNNKCPTECEERRKENNVESSHGRGELRTNTAVIRSRHHRRIMSQDPGAQSLTSP